MSDEHFGLSRNLLQIKFIFFDHFFGRFSIFMPSGFTESPLCSARCAWRTLHQIHLMRLVAATHPRNLKSLVPPGNTSYPIKALRKKETTGSGEEARATPSPPLSSFLLLSFLLFSSSFPLLLLLECMRYKTRESRAIMKG